MHGVDNNIQQKGSVYYTANKSVHFLLFDESRYLQEIDVVRNWKFKVLEGVKILKTPS